MERNTHDEIPRKELEMAVYALREHFPDMTPEEMAQRLTAPTQAASEERSECLDTMTTGEVASTLKVHRSTVFEFIRQGKLEVMRPGRRTTRITRRSVEALARRDGE